MNYFLFKLYPPRVTFPADITRAEGKLIQEHSDYWSQLMNRGFVLAFGPVVDPKGTYCIAIIQLEDGGVAIPVCSNDPMILANVGFTFEVQSLPLLRLPQPTYPIVPTEQCPEYEVTSQFSSIYLLPT